MSNCNKCFHTINRRAGGQASKQAKKNSHHHRRRAISEHIKPFLKSKVTFILFLHAIYILKHMVAFYTFLSCFSFDITVVGASTTLNDHHHRRHRCRRYDYYVPHRQIMHFVTHIHTHSHMYEYVYTYRNELYDINHQKSETIKRGRFP
jgi:hypothetical protein